MKTLFVFALGIAAGAAAYKYWESSGQYRPELQALKDRGQEVLMTAKDRGAGIAERITRQTVEQGVQLAEQAGEGSEHLSN